MSAKNPLQAIARFFLLPLSALSNRIGNNFYLGLAVIVAVVAAIAIATGSTAGMKNKAYDLIMKTRFQHPKPDPDIVIVDIDEPALAAMAPEFGRWPWPRNIMGELVEGISAQKPRAIVFDILFSDPDVFNAEGDKYLRNVIAITPNTFFPMIRLSKNNDTLSKLPVRRLPGVTKLESTASDASTLAVVLPFFFDELRGHRLGTNNIYTDDDGMARTYDVYANEYGWRVGSLPGNVVASLGGKAIDRQNILLNWRGRPPAYQHVSFHKVYFDFQNQKRTRAANEFTGKIVIIGSTAPSLYDLKTTPMAKAHPGVEILANAIDNLKNRDYLTELPAWNYILITWVSVAMLTMAFVYNIDQRVVNLTFTILQSGFLAVSYLTLNFSTVFVDLTAPFAVSLLYFTVARFNYMFAGYRRSGQPFFSTILDEGNSCAVILVQCHLHIPHPRARLALGASLKRQVGRSRFGLVTPAFFKGMPLLHAFFRQTTVFYWLVPQEKTSDALQDVINVMENSQPAIRKSASRYNSGKGATATWLLHYFTFTVDATDAWRLQGEEGVAKLFALSSRTGDAVDNTVTRVLATHQFTDACRVAEALKIPQDLEQAGLNC